MRRRTFLLHAARSTLALGVLGPLGACRRGEPAPQEAGDPRFVALRDRYFLEFLIRNPVTSTYLGGDGYDPRLRPVGGRLRDYRPEALREEAALWRAIQRELAAFAPERLPPRDRVDHRVMAAQLAFLLHEIEELRWHERAVDTYVAEPFRGVDWQLQQLSPLERGGLGTAEEWELVAARLAAIPPYLDTAIANLLAGKAAGNLPDRRVLQHDGVEGSRANADYFRTTVAELARRSLAGRPDVGRLASEVERAAGAAANAFTGFARFLEQTFDLAEPTDRYAVGEEEYAWRLRNNLREPRSPAELFEYGAAEVARYRAEVFRVAEEVGRALGVEPPAGEADRPAHVRRVMARLAADAPRSDEELFGWYREAGARLVAYGRARGLFAIPEDYRLEVVPTPPLLRSTIDAAYYPAPPFKRGGVGRFYVTPSEGDPARLRLQPRAAIPDTAAHEGFPGHDWHYRFMAAHAAEIPNVRWLTPGAVEDSSSMWSDSPATEGWGLYAEELVAEPAPGRPYGFYEPAEYLYELQGQLLRAARVHVDVGLHTGRLGFDEAVGYLAETVWFYPGACARAEADPDARAVCESARRAAYRYSKWPTQAVTYNLGKRAILELREAYRARRGAAYSPREFHERLLRMGTIAIGHYRDEFLAAANEPATSEGG